MHVFSNDLLKNYIMFLDMKNIYALLQINKNASTLFYDQHIWKLKIEQCVNNSLLTYHFTGKYTWKEYCHVCLALEHSKLLYNKSVLFKCTTEDFNKIKDDKHHILRNYYVILYQSQEIFIDKNDSIIHIKCFFKYGKGINHNIWNYPCKDIKLFLFNIFYHYYNVPYYEVAPIT